MAGGAPMTGRKPTACHCGKTANGYLDGYCQECSDVRCDAYPGACAGRETARSTWWRSLGGVGQHYVISMVCATLGVTALIEIGRAHV